MMEIVINRPDWKIYIPEEGHWDIRYSGKDYAGARQAYLKWANRKRLPPGSYIENFNRNNHE